MAVHWSLLLPKSLWYPGSQRAYTYPDADSYLDSMLVRADAASMNGKGGSDIWRRLALLQVPIKVCGAWKGVQRWRDAAGPQTHGW